MTEAARTFITTFPKIIWQLFTGVKIPGLNFTPAVFFFGILTFGVVWRLVFSILHVHTFFGRGNPDQGNEPYQGLHKSKNYYEKDTWS